VEACRVLFLVGGLDGVGLWQVWRCHARAIVPRRVGPGLRQADAVYAAC
jgi:hypothetical protein